MWFLISIYAYIFLMFLNRPLCWNIGCVFLTLVVLPFMTNLQLTTFLKIKYQDLLSSAVTISSSAAAEGGNCYQYCCSNQQLSCNYHKHCWYYCTQVPILWSCPKGYPRSTGALGSFHLTALSAINTFRKVWRRTKRTSYVCQERKG